MTDARSQHLAVASAKAQPGGINWLRLGGRVLLYGALTLLLILFMVPVYGAIVTAFKSIAEVSAGGYWTPPSSLELVNFERVLDPEIGNLGLYLGNSFLLTLPASLFSISLGDAGGLWAGQISLPRRWRAVHFHRGGHVPAAADRADTDLPPDE